MKFSYVPEGVCPSLIQFDIDDGVVHGLEFTDGCDGNLKVVSLFCEGMSPEQIIERFSGVTCDNRGTSCIGQLCTALTEALEGRKED